MLLPWTIETETISSLIIIFPINCSADSFFLGPRRKTGFAKSWGYP
jgi:hypothetical protein